MPDVPTFASHEELERFASRDQVRFNEQCELGTRVQVGGRPALIMGIDVGVASRRALRVAVSLRYLDEEI